jgi:hypothetical protein
MTTRCIFAIGIGRLRVSDAKASDDARALWAQSFPTALHLKVESRRAALSDNCATIRPLRLSVRIRLEG